MTSTSPAPTAATGAPATTTLRGRTQRLVGLRKIIAQRMVASLRDSAQLTSVIEVDLTGIAELRARAKADFEAREGVKLSYLPFLAKAALEASGASQGQRLDRLRRRRDHLPRRRAPGVAVDTEKGLWSR